MNRRFITIVLIWVAILLALWTAATAEASVHSLTVDGVVYEPTKTSGPVVHYETPDVDPQVAFTERHTWTGNGSENLPCEGGIHWVDNENLLTVSHCLPLPTTTTSTTSTTTSSTTTSTTTLPTTTTSEATTTTTSPTTTSSSTSLPSDSSTTTVVKTTTTTKPECGDNDPSCLPVTGAPDWLEPLGLAAVLAIPLGMALLYGTRRKGIT